MAASAALGRGADLEDDDMDDIRCPCPCRSERATARRHSVCRRRSAAASRPPPPLLACSPFLPREERRGQNAFEREYEDDHSWEELEEDEFGNLRAPVRACWVLFCTSSAAGVRPTG